MEKHGFVPYPQEWWHFTLANEPFPRTAFDFEIPARAVSRTGPSGARLLTNVVGFDDGPFDRARRGARVLLVGAVCARTRLDGVISGARHEGRPERDGAWSRRWCAGRSSMATSGPCC